MQRQNWRNIKRFLTKIYNKVDSFGSYYSQGLKGRALPSDAPTYVFRDADDELYEFVQKTDRDRPTCYILAAPKMGKSSLMVRTAKRLFNEGNICIQIALQMSGQTVSEELLYLSFLRSICQKFKISGQSLLPEIEALWETDKNVTPVERFQKNIIYILSKIGNKKIVIFIDDIQTLITWKLQGSLIGAIANLSASDEPSLQRLTFVLLGVAKAEDLFADAGETFNIAKRIELGNLKGDCQALLPGLNKVSYNPAEVLKRILFWTGGQPFLTQLMCDLAAKRVTGNIHSEVKSQIQELAQSEIIQNWQNRELLRSHFQEIENCFIKDSDNPDRIKENLYALNLYKHLLRERKRVKFSESSSKQTVLLLSGLVTKFDEIIDVANPIYKEIFNRKWVEETKKIINQKKGEMAIPQIYNRDVFILIDRSGSMTTKDTSTGAKTRWQYLQETVQGHVFEILNEQDDDYGIICNEVTLYFFNANRPPAKTIYLRDAAQVEGAFKENKPNGSTFIAPTLNEAINQWFSNRTNDKGALVVIYTDGQLDDRNEFVNAISATCARLNSQDEIKILLIGIGTDIDPVFYLDIDLNVSQFKSRRGEDCNIFIFDLIDDVMEEGIIAAFERQLEGDPKKGLAPWIKERYPEWYKKRFGS